MNYNGIGYAQQNFHVPQLSQGQWRTVLHLSIGAVFPPGNFSVEGFRNLGRDALVMQYQELQLANHDWQRAYNMATVADRFHSGSGNWAVVEQLGNALKQKQKTIDLLEFALSPLAAIQKRHQQRNAEDLLLRDYEFQLGNVGAIQAHLLQQLPSPQRQTALTEAWRQELAVTQALTLALHAAVVAEKEWGLLELTVNPNIHLDTSRELNLAILHDTAIARSQAVEKLLRGNLPTPPGINIGAVTVPAVGPQPAAHSSLPAATNPVAHASPSVPTVTPAPANGSQSPPVSVSPTQAPVQSAEEAWLQQALPSLKEKSNLVAVLDFVTDKNRNGADAPLDKLQTEARDLAKAGAARLKFLQKEYEHELQIGSQHSGSTMHSENLDNLASEIRGQRNRLTLLELMLEPESILRRWQDAKTKEDAELFKLENAHESARLEVDRLEKLPVTDTQNDLTAARQAELRHVDALREMIAKVKTAAEDWTAVQEKACAAIPCDSSRQETLKVWDDDLTIRKQELNIQVAFPEIQDPSDADLYLSFRFGVENYGAIWKGLSPEVKDAVFKLKRLEDKEPPSIERKVKEIALHPPLKDALEIFLPPANATELAALCEAQVGKDPDMSDYLPGLATALTRVTLVADFRASERAREKLKKRWVSVLEAAACDSHTRNTLVTSAKECLGDCVNPIIFGLGQFEKAAAMYQGTLIAHDMTQLIDFTEERFKGQLIDEVGNLVRATLLSNKEAVQTDLQLAKLAGAALGMKNAPSSVDYEDSGGVEKEDVECVTQIFRALVSGVREDIPNAIEPLRSRLNVTLANHKHDPHYTDRCVEMVEEFQRSSKVLETKQLTFDEFLIEDRVFLNYVENLFNREPRFHADPKTLDTIKSDIVEIQKKLADVNKQIDDFEIGGVKGDPYQSVKRVDGWTDAEFDESKARNEKAMAPHRARIDALFEQQTNLYLIEQAMHKRAEAKTNRVVALAKQFMLVKELTEKETKQGEIYEYRPLSENKSDRLDHRTTQYPEVARQLMQMQFDIAKARDVPGIRVDPFFSVEEKWEMRLAAQLAGLPVQGYTPGISERESFNTELNARLAKLCATMPEKALARYQVLAFENAKGVRLAGGIVVKTDEKGNAWVNSREASATPKLVKVSKAVQIELGILLVHGRPADERLVVPPKKRIGNRLAKIM